MKMKKVSYAEIKTDPEFREGAEIIRRWIYNDPFVRQNHHYNLETRRFSYDLEMIKKLDKVSEIDANVLKTVEDKLAFLDTGISLLRDVPFEKLIKLQPYYRYRTYYYNVPEKPDSLVADIIRAFTPFEEKGNTVFNNCSRLFSEDYSLRNQEAVNHHYYLLKLFAEGESTSTMLDMKKKDPVGIDVNFGETLTKLKKFNEYEGFVRKNYYNTEVNTPFAKIAYMLVNNLVGSYDERRPKGFWKVLEGLDKETWEMFAETVTRGRVRNIHTIKALREFISGLKPMKKEMTIYDVEDSFTNNSLEVLAKNKVGFMLSKEFIDIMPSRYNLRDSIDLNSLAELSELIKKEDPTLMELAILLVAIGNRGRWIRGSNANSYSSLLKLLELDFSGGLGLIDFLLRENKGRSPSVSEWQEFIRNYDGEFELGIQNSILLSMISQLDDDKVVRKNNANVKERLNKIENSLKQLSSH